MNTEEIIEGQRQDWNRVAPGWEKWDRFFDRNLTFINHRLVGDARLREGQQVLDLGSGTGYPALLAARTVGNQGRVVGLDLAEGMLAAARRKAQALGLANVTFRTADVTTLPFESDSFDAVTSRFCLMFLPDIPKAIGEIARVLKPGGYVAAAVWSTPDNNPYLRIPMDVIKQHIELPPPDPEQPGIFRLAKPGDLRSMAERAGFHGLTDEELAGEVAFDSARDYVTSVMELAAPLQTLFAKLSPSQQREAEEGFERLANQYRKDSGIALPIVVRIVAGRKSG
ncbi:MAG: class I SAM-dependent methyltransferase [Nitrospiraceae bacterium]